MSEASGIQLLSSVLTAGGALAVAILALRWVLFGVRARLYPVLSSERVRVRVRRRPKKLTPRWLPLMGLGLTLALPAGAKASRSPLRDAAPAQQPWQPVGGDFPPPPPAGAEVPGEKRGSAPPPWKDQSAHAAIHGSKNGAIHPLFPRAAGTSGTRHSEEGAPATSGTRHSEEGAWATSGIHYGRPTEGDDAVKEQRIVRPGADPDDVMLPPDSESADVESADVERSDVMPPPDADHANQLFLPDAERADVMLPPQEPIPIGRNEGTLPRSARCSRDTRDRDARAEKIACMRRHPAGKAIRSDASAARELGSRLHVVRPGESLWFIAARVLDTEDQARIARYWPRIHRANRAVIGSDPNLIYAGQRLVLPQESRR